MKIISYANQNDQLGPPNENDQLGHQMKMSSYTTQNDRLGPQIKTTH